MFFLFFAILLVFGVLSGAPKGVSLDLCSFLPSGFCVWGTKRVPASIEAGLLGGFGVT